MTAARTMTRASRLKLGVTSRLALLAAVASRVTGRGSGTVVGGQVLLRLNPDAIAQLAEGRTCLLVSGSNGKTTTTKFLADAARTKGDVATNFTGSNMTTGIATALLVKARTAVLEVDEFYLERVVAATAPSVVVLTNLSRDQLDRTGGVADLVQTWRRTLAATAPGTVAVTTCNDPLTAWAASGAPRAVWVATSGRWAADSTLCPSCSSLLSSEGDHWWCHACGFARPTPDWTVDGDVLTGPDGVSRRITLSLPGRANRINAAFAVAAAVELGVSPDDALAAASRVAEVQGRFSSVRRGGHDVRLLLAKNPASWTEVLDMVAPTGGPLIFASNGRAADGRDLSWLYDVPFEILAGRKVGVIGDRRLDMAVRLQAAGASPQLAPTLDDALRSLPAGPVDVIASYTALQDLRAELATERP